MTASTADSSRDRPLRLGTRGSALALAQAEFTRTLLRAAHPSLEIEILVIQSLGDLVRDRPLSTLGAQGIFTHALEQALLEGNIDVAVHSAKDLPSSINDAFLLAAAPAREDPSDCLVTLEGLPLAELPLGARIGTGSPRRATQLLALRPDLRLDSIRGNVDTRRRAAIEGRFDGVILAAAGLKRLGLFDRYVQPLSVEACLPQAGQGILALEILAANDAVRSLLAAVHDTAIGACLAAERAVLAGLAAGCQAPVAAFATTNGAHLQIRGLVAGPLGQQILRESASGPASAARDLGTEVALHLRARGAEGLLGSARTARE